MNVQRYELEIYHCNGGEMLASETGDYVSHEDYAALEARCAALAAENAGLKSALNPEVIPDAAVEAFTETAIMDHDWNETGEWSWVENDTDVIRAVLEAIKTETPATDAHQAELRAQGVEMFAREMHADISEADAIEFAAQLRKGASA